MTFGGKSMARSLTGVSALFLRNLFFRGLYQSQLRIQAGRFFLRKNRGTLILLIVVLSGAYRAWSACTPPDPIAVQLKTRHDAAIYAELGIWFAQQHQYACATESFKTAVAADPASARYTYLLGLSLYSAGLPGEAVEPLQKSIGLDPKYVDAYLTLGAAFDQMGDRAKAEAQWRLALTILPQSALALDNLSRDLLADGNYSSVIALLKPMADRGSLTTPLLVKLSVAYSKSGLLEDASALLYQALRANPSSLPLVEALAGVLILQMRVQEAAEIVKTAASQHPHDVSVQVLYLRTLVLANDTAHAEAISRVLLTSSPNDWEVLYLTGFLKLLEGNYPAAQSYLEQSVTQKSDYSESRFDLGVDLARMKEYSAAKEQLQKANAL
ncbi:MAG: tetratricopeptide repeat protein, partial [Silvibacterium sp.]